MTTSASAQVLEDFLIALSPGTRLSYARDLASAEVFLRDHGVSLLEAERRHLERLIGHCRDLQLAPATISRRLAALSGFYRYACAEGVLPQSPMTWVRRPRVPPRPPRRGLDVQEARLLLEAARQHSLRAHAAVAVLLGTGLRASALCNADATDVLRSPTSTTLRYLNKGGGVSLTVLTKHVLTVLDAYLGGRADGPLLASAGRVGRLDRTGLHRTLKQVAATALPGRHDVSAHTLRATFAQLALQAGAGLHDTSAALAHSCLRSTEPYLSDLLLHRHPAHLIAPLLAESHPTLVEPAISFRQPAGG